MMLLIWLSGITAAVVFFGITWYLAPLDPNILSLQFAFSSQRFGEVIHRWSPESLERYRDHLSYDFVLLLAYGFFGYLLTTRTKVFGSLAPGVGHFAKWVLPLAAVFDVLENTLHYWLTATPRFEVPGVYALSAGASLFKWVLIVGFGVLVACAQARR